MSNFAERGKTNYLAGLGAEESVSKDYADRGYRVKIMRFRGKRGEIDLIVEDGHTTVFVEVKRAKTHENAALRVTADKIARLYTTAEEYLIQAPAGSLTPTRFDVALVDQFGRVKVLENALMA